MSTTTTIICPQGLQRLSDLGMAVARSQDWARPDAREALVGLWLASQVARAELRSALEVVPTESGSRAQIDVTTAPVGRDALSLDAALRAVWGRLAREAVAAGLRPADSEEVSVRLPPEAGALPAVVVVAMIAGASWVLSTLGGRIVEQLGAASQRSAELRRAMNENQQVIAIGDAVRQRPGQELNEAERKFIAGVIERQASASKQLNEPPPKKEDSGFFGDLFSGAETPFLVLFALGAAWWLRRGR